MALRTDDYWENLSDLCNGIVNDIENEINCGYAIDDLSNFNIKDDYNHDRIITSLYYNKNENEIYCKFSQGEDERLKVQGVNTLIEIAEAIIQLSYNEE